MRYHTICHQVLVSYNILWDITPFVTTLGSYILWDITPFVTKLGVDITYYEIRHHLSPTLVRYNILWDITPIWSPNWCVSYVTHQCCDQMRYLIVCYTTPICHNIGSYNSLVKYHTICDQHWVRITYYEISHPFGHQHVVITYIVWYRHPIWWPNWVRITYYEISHHLSPTLGSYNILWDITPFVTNIGFV